MPRPARNLAPRCVRPRAGGAWRATGLALCLLGAALSHADDRNVFRWVGADGEVYYSDVPRDADSRRLDIANRATDNDRITEQKQARIETQQTERLKALENVQVAESAEAEKARFAENCARARKALTSLQEASRLYVPTDDGGRRFLDDSERELRIAKARSDVSDWCR